MNSQSNNPKGSRSGVCYDFQKGKCRRGDSCRYAHQEMKRPVRTSSSSGRENNSRYGRENSSKDGRENSSRENNSRYGRENNSRANNSRYGRENNSKYGREKKDSRKPRQKESLATTPPPWAGPGWTPNPAPWKGVPSPPGSWAAVVAAPPPPKEPEPCTTEPESEEVVERLPVLLEF